MAARAAIVFAVVFVAGTVCLRSAERASEDATDAAAVPPPPKAVTEEDVLAAQAAWGDGVVSIAAAKASGGDCERLARDHIDALYGFGRVPVLLKPTQGTPRFEFDGALSCFVADDEGFGTKGCQGVRWENNDIILSGGTAMAMGNVFFTSPDGSESKYEYSLGYFLDEDGKLRINMHHSSKPFHG